MTQKTDALVDNVRQALDASVEHLDASTLSRLNQARQHAFAAGNQRPWRLWLGAAACACLVLVLAWPQPATSPQVSTALLESDLELLEDMDMLTWLKSQDLLKDGTS